MQKKLAKKYGTKGNRLSVLTGKLRRAEKLTIDELPRRQRHLLARFATQSNQSPDRLFARLVEMEKRKFAKDEMQSAKWWDRFAKMKFKPLTPEQIELTKLSQAVERLVRES